MKPIEDDIDWRKKRKESDARTTGASLNLSQLFVRTPVCRESCQEVWWLSRATGTTCKAGMCARLRQMHGSFQIHLLEIPSALIDETRRMLAKQ